MDRHLPEGRGENIAVECADQKVSYRGLLEWVNRVGNMLRGLGVRIEERVAILLPDSPEFLYAFLERSRLAQSQCHSTPTFNRLIMNIC